MSFFIIAPFPFFNQNKKPRKAFTSNPVSNTSNSNNTVYTTSSYNNTPQSVTRHHRVTDKRNSYIQSSAGQPELVQRQYVIIIFYNIIIELYCCIDKNTLVNFHLDITTIMKTQVHQRDKMAVDSTPLHNSDHLKK